MAKEDKQGNLHSDKNGQFVSKGAADVARKYEKYTPSEETDYKVKEDNKSTIREQVTANTERIKGSPIIAEISKQDITADFRAAMKGLKEALLATGGAVKRDNFGTIQIDSRIKQAGAYLKNTAEISALAVVPQVIKEGIEISSHSDHKGRQYRTWTIAGRVNVAGKSGVVAVVIKETTDKFYKVHRVFTPDGDILQI